MRISTFLSLHATFQAKKMPENRGIQENEECNAMSLRIPLPFLILAVIDYGHTLKQQRVNIRQTVKRTQSSLQADCKKKQLK